MFSMPDWNPDELGLIVSEYFDMLLRELNGESYDSGAYLQGLREVLDGRSGKWIEFKLANISAALADLNLPCIAAYPPDGNVQGVLTEAVREFARDNPGPWKLSEPPIPDEQDVAPHAEPGNDGPESNNSDVPGAGEPAPGADPADDSSSRRAVETRAMDVATAFYSSTGWSVKAADPGQPFELVCTRESGPELHVAVRGTAGPGLPVFLAPPDVEHARTYKPFDLYLLHGVSMDRSDPSCVRAEGGRPELVQDWDPSDDRLRPTGYAYLPPDTLAS